jgi:hypothetical protein
MMAVPATADSAYWPVRRAASTETLAVAVTASTSSGKVPC